MRRAALGLISVLLVACGGRGGDAQPEPVDASAETPAGMTLGAPCSPAGTLGCQGVGQKLQLLCDGSKWVANGVCAGDLVCDPRPGPTLGSCQTPTCKPGAPRCDGANLLECGADLLTETRTSCSSAEHCKQAVGNVCAKCLTGEMKCEGADLKKCASDHQGFVLEKTCASTAVCDATTGTCTETGPCAPGSYRCNGDVLEKCSDTSSFGAVTTCAAGLCDATLKKCRECPVGGKDCQGTIPRTCDSTGSWLSTGACSGSTPYCKDGACTATACSAGEYRCSEWSTLEKCNATQTGFEVALLCPEGLCDAVGKECNECKPGEKGCAGNVPRTCDSTGRWMLGTACSGSTPYCSAATCVASTLVSYSQSFTTGVVSGPGTAQCTAWSTFRAALAAGTFTKITLTGSKDSAPTVTCSGTAANNICRALGTGTTANITCDGRTWRVAECSGGGGSNWELSAGSSGTCGCFWGWDARPCMGTVHWGGAASDTCDPPSQTITVKCE